MALHPVPHAGLLSPDRRNAVDCSRLECDRRRNLGFANLGAARPGDRPRQRRVDGTQEGGRLFLMALLEAPTDHALTAAQLEHGDKPTLRIVTCGSVDDGKSTLVGRL